MERLIVAGMIMALLSALGIGGGGCATEHDRTREVAQVEPMDDATETNVAPLRDAGDERDEDAGRDDR